MVKKILIAGIKFWQKFLSPQTGLFRFVYSSPIINISAPSNHYGCRFWPTCSHYAIESLEKYPTLVAIKLSFNRISRCHSFNEGGIDKVPNDR